jgi:hypothetical protein
MGKQLFRKKYCMRKIIYSILLLFGQTSFAQFITNNGIQIVNSAKVIANGDWSNASGTSIKNDGTIITSENWTNNGTLSGIGGFVLNYASDKNFTPGGRSQGFLTKKGAGAALLTGSIYVTDSLLLINGLLKLSSTLDTVWVKSGVVVAGSSSYVEGNIAHSGIGDKLFPFGRDGNYLPLKLVKFNATKATASVVTAPGGYTAGPGVEALISFPYVWKVSEKIVTDTSAYVEINYPNTLPTTPTPIVTREVSGLQYESMGARAITNVGGTVTVRSYSPRLMGAFTIAKGFPSDFTVDSLALVALYNSTGGPTWTNKTNWLTTPVMNWFGVTVTGQSITSVSLPNNKLTGAVADPVVGILSLQTVNLSTNALTTIPKFADNSQIKTLNVSNNKLEFSSLEPNASLIKPGSTFTYLNQADIGVSKSTLVDVGNPHSFTASPDAPSNIYQWKRNGVAVSGGVTREYTIESISRINMGQYVCEISNPLLPGLTLKTAAETALAVASLEGKLFAAPSTAATKGKMTLFKVNIGTAYDITDVQQIQSDGSYKFEKVVLDDYQVLGFLDTLAVGYSAALPTYYQNTIFWEEANTIPVNSNLNSLNITSNYKPTGGAKGVGIISGFFEEPATGGRIEAAKRVAGAGASVRRVENNGRPLGENLTLVAYVYTNKNGEFEIPELPKGNYRLNLQYPGYPMDPTTFVTIPIGDGLESQVRVAANVDAGKIKVNKLVITGVWNKEGYKADVFPNPSVSLINLHFGHASSQRSVHLLNVEGKEIANQTASNKEEVVDVRNLAPGIYLLNVLEGGHRVKILRVVVEKD